MTIVRFLSCRSLQFSDSLLVCPVIPAHHGHWVLDPWFRAKGRTQEYRVAHCISSARRLRALPCPPCCLRPLRWELTGRPQELSPTLFNNPGEQTSLPLLCPTIRIDFP